MAGNSKLCSELVKEFTVVFSQREPNLGFKSRQFHCSFYLYISCVHCICIKFRQPWKARENSKFKRSTCSAVWIVWLSGSFKAITSFKVAAFQNGFSKQFCWVHEHKSFIFRAKIALITPSARSTLMNEWIKSRK